MKKNQTYKNLNYDFSDYAEEITGDALFMINGGAQIENSIEAQANAKVGDTVTNSKGETHVLTQGDITWAQEKLGITTFNEPQENSCNQTCNTVGEQISELKEIYTSQLINQTDSKTDNIEFKKNLLKNFSVALASKDIIHSIVSSYEIIKEFCIADTQIIGATYDFINQYNIMKAENIIGNDNFNHAMANSKAAQRGWYGKKTAQLLSFLRELTDVIRKGDSDKDIREDNIANRYGRNIPQGADPFEYNSIFDTRNGGNRADLSGIASDDTPKNFFDFCNSYFTRDKYE